MNLLRIIPRRKNIVFICVSLTGLIVLVEILSLTFTGSSQLTRLRDTHRSSAWRSSDRKSSHRENYEHTSSSNWNTSDASPNYDEEDDSGQLYSEINTVVASETHIAPLGEPTQTTYEPVHQSLSIDEDPFYRGLCTEYFHDLYDFDNFWGIEPYGGPSDYSNRINTRRSVRHVRSYLNCFMRNNVKIDRNLTDLESRLFPAFRPDFPVYKRYDGKEVIRRLPTAEDYEHTTVVKRETPESQYEAELEAEYEAKAELDLERFYHSEQSAEDFKESTEYANEYANNIDEAAEAARKAEEEARERENAERRERERLNEHFQYIADHSFWNEFRSQMNGRGIVLSIGEGRGIGEIRRLLRVLRMQGNKLPIQLIHKGDLSEASEKILIEAARAPFSVPRRTTPRKQHGPFDTTQHKPPQPSADLFSTDSDHHSGGDHSDGEHSSERIGEHNSERIGEHNSEHIGEHSSERVGEHSSERIGEHTSRERIGGHFEARRSSASYDEIIYNPQDLWFVNTRPTVADEAYSLFGSFNNKWLAVLLNSFDEMIMMDTDSVPFIQMDSFFYLDGYTRDQAYLFQDRAVNYLQISEEDAEFMASLLPSEKESKLFNMKPLTDYTRKNPMIDPSTRYLHYIESGLLVISRKRHLPELLMCVSVQFLTPASKATYGDKEMFWFGFAVAGSEEYYINPVSAGSIGVQESGYEGTRRDGTKFDYNITSSTQPAHLSPEHKLLWINSGMVTCKIDDAFQSDFDGHHEIRDKYDNALQWREWLQSPLEADGVLLFERILPQEYSQIQVHEVGFKQCTERGCRGYTWCGFDNPDYPGYWVPFDNATRAVFDRTSLYWNGDAVYYNDPDSLRLAEALIEGA